MTDREFAVQVVSTLKAAGFRALFAGGCVRDEILGIAPADYDVATDARPEQVMQLFRRCIAVGAAFGVVEVLGPRDSQGEWLRVQVATFRTDGHYTDGRRPDDVKYATPEEDAARRDFTMNGLFLDPTDGTIFDYVGGRADIASKVLRAIGDPAARFAEDRLRVLRAVRMAARFGFAVDPSTQSAAAAVVHQLGSVSAERIADELRKMLKHPARGRACRLLAEFGLHAVLFPEVAGEWDRLIDAVARLPAAATFPTAFAALTRFMTPSALRAVVQRFRLSNDEAERILWLVGHRASLGGASGLPASVRSPLLAHAGAAELIALMRATEFAADAEFCAELLRTTPRDVLDPPPLLTGDDLIAAGWKPGPRFRVALQRVRAAQLDGAVSGKIAAMELASQVQ